MTQPVNRYCLIMLLLLIWGPGCQKDEETTRSTITVSIQHKVNQAPLALANTSYTNALGQPFTVTAFKYYLSNFTFTRADGSRVRINGQYYFVDEAVPESKKLTIANVPFGDYTGMSFTIGVDSIRNVSGAQTGALDPLSGMFWSWNSGYIMAKFEGTSKVSTAADTSLVFHVGGFKGEYNSLQTVALNTGSFKVPDNTHIALTADVATWFNTPNPISFITINKVHTPGIDGYKFSQNYSNMFTSVAVSE
ncbi:hypothetical protein MKQ70_18440 [Chitinophaga sedimenti]|uniref:MbnP family protein n=1 Tax=Chitinophaga sedimenti TaxID=2033606 RepID=UPI0020055400|nr:MbnP family protein [Chitinophaga sedimenti]MCK7556886.1 hypothetical protein [Chitinophaga sedimenti]